MPRADPHLSLRRSQQQGLVPTQWRKRTSRCRDFLRSDQPHNLCRTCGEDFTSARLFDEHRVGKHEYLHDPWDDSKADGRRCLDFDEMVGGAGNRMGLAAGSARTGHRMRGTVYGLTPPGLRPCEGLATAFPHLNQQRAFTRRSWSREFRLSERVSRNEIGDESMSVRKRLAEAATEDYELIREALRNGIKAKKEHWFTCRHCQKKTKVNVTDQSAVNRSIEIWLDQGFGRTVQEEPVQPQNPVEQLNIEELRLIAADIKARQDPELVDFIERKSALVAGFDVQELEAMIVFWREHKLGRNGRRP